jgi:peptide/nickel transport system substrate-binding protein
MYAKMWWDGLYEFPLDGVGLAPGIAAGYEIDDAKMVMTVYLRPGLKWSDGHEFTTDDIRFMYDDIVNYVTKDGVARTVRNWGSLPQFKEMGVIDDYTIRMGTYNGVGTGPLEMAGWQGSRAQCFQPAHYLKQFHIKYNPDAEKIAARDGYDTWQDSIRTHYFWGDKVDINMPDITPWLLKDRDQTTRLYERNPYYYKVDPAGNQLPYIDRLVVRIVADEVVQLKITGGEADYAYSTTTMDNIELYKTSEAAGDYKTVMVAGLSPSNYTFSVNNNYDEPGSPMRELFNNLSFRAALSVAINRDEINEILAKGLGVPSQATMHPKSSYYVDGWAEYYAQYDTNMANRLLDEAGLDKKDSQGFRIGPDGNTFSLVVEYADTRVNTFLELVKEYWEDVGVKTTIKLEDIGLLDQRQKAGLLAITVTGPNNPNSTERGGFMSLWTWTGSYSKVGQWDRFKGTVVREHTGETQLDPDNWAYTETPRDGEWVSGEYDGTKHEWPTDWYIEREVLKDKWRVLDMGTPEWVELGKQVFDMNIKPLNFIGTVGQIPSIIIVKNGLRNHMVSGWSTALGVSHLLNMRWSPQLWWDRDDRRLE